MDANLVYSITVVARGTCKKCVAGPTSCVLGLSAAPILFIRQKTRERQTERAEQKHCGGPRLARGSIHNYQNKNGRMNTVKSLQDVRGCYQGSTSGRGSGF
jgi:hypothetical protein